MEDLHFSASEINVMLNELIEGKKESKTTGLTSAEASNLWNQYMGDIEAVCLYTYYHKVVEDKEIRDILEQALQMSQKHISKVSELFLQAQYPVPIGFTITDDVNLNAPPLFSDRFMLYFSHIMTIHGLTAYSLAISTSERDDIRKHFIDSAASATELLNKTILLCKAKGQYTESPTLPPPESVQFMEKKGAIADLFADPKPLNASEINNLFFNMKKTILAKTSAIAFSQVTESSEIRRYFQSAAELAGQHLDTMRTILNQDNLPSPPLLEAEITNSTISPFSDRLMMFHMGFKLSASIAYYGTGMGSSIRADLITTYSKIIFEVLKLANEWLSIMVKHKWLEKQPEAVDRKALAQGKKEH